MKNTDIIVTQRSLALLPFLPFITSKYIKESGRLIPEIYGKALCKLKPKICEVECISSEYFEYLLSRNTFKIDFTGDINSCALIGIDSLAILSQISNINSKAWIKIQKCDFESSTIEQTKSGEENEWTDSKLSKNKYFLQCIPVSMIRKQLVLYVTYTKYFNILETFNIRDIQNLKVEIDKITCQGCPAIAENLILGIIGCGVDVKEEDVAKIVKMHFSTPKQLKKHEVFQINVQKMLSNLGSSVNYINTKYIYFKVLSVTSNSGEGKEEFGFYIVDGRTKVKISGRANSYLPKECTKFIFIRDKESYEIPICPGGLDEYFLKLKGIFEFFINNRDSHLKPMILLKGVKGSGKKTVLKSVAANLGLKLYSMNCFDFIRTEASSSDTKFVLLVDKVLTMSPVIFHLENIELVGRDESYKEEVVVIGMFQKMIDQIFGERYRHLVIIVATCSQKRPELLPSIERMFIQTVSFKSIKKEDAIKLLNWLVYEAGMTCYEDVVKNVAERVNGYLFADIIKLMRIALKYQREEETISENIRLLTMDHMEKALSVVDSNYSDFIGSAKVPSVHWEDVGGLENLKEEITISLNFPTNHPELIASGLRASGFLFYGPPGTGKTLMAKAVATEFRYNFLSVKGPELMNMYVGQSERNVREVFQRAREAAPCVIFFDELDSLAPNRGRESSAVMGRIVSQLLTEMDGLESNVGVFVIGATNRPDLVDPGLLRPGRFDKMFHVGICSTTEMKLSVMKALTRRFSFDGDVDLEAVVNKLPTQVTGADLYSICSTAWVEAAHRHINNTKEGEEVELPVTVKLNDFEKAVSKFVPSLTPEIIQSYELFKSV